MPVPGRICSRLATLPGTPSLGSAAKLTLPTSLRLPLAATLASSAEVTLVVIAGSGACRLTIARVAVPSNTFFDDASTVAGVNILPSTAPLKIA